MFAIANGRTDSEATLPRLRIAAGNTWDSAIFGSETSQALQGCQESSVHITATFIANYVSQGADDFPGKFFLSPPVAALVDQPPRRRKVVLRRCLNATGREFFLGLPPHQAGHTVLQRDRNTPLKMESRSVSSFGGFRKNELSEQEPLQEHDCGLFANLGLSSGKNAAEYSVGKPAACYRFNQVSHIIFFRVLSLHTQVEIFL